MNKILYLFIALALFLFSCKNSDKTSKSDDNSDTSSIEIVDDYELETDNNVMFLSYNGDASFDNFLSFFEETEPPFTSYPDFPYGELKVIPDEFRKYAGTDLEEYEYIFPVFKFDIYNQFKCLYFVTTDLAMPLTSYLCIYDNSGNLISSQEIYYSYYSGEEFSFLKIDKYYNVYVLDAFLDRGSSWNYQEDGIAYYLSYTEDYEIMPTDRYSISEEGEITPIETLDFVVNFLEKLGSGDFKDAFELQNNPAWGDYESFSSPNAFGGIIDISVDSLKILSQTDNSAEIYCSATYIDTINGNSNVKQKFILSKKDNKWLISQMKVIEFERFASYSCDDFEYSELSLTNITKDNFTFDLLIVSPQPEDSAEKYAGSIFGEAEFLSPEHAIYDNGDSKIDFYFSGTTKVKVVETNCEKYRHESLSFDGVYTD